MKRAEVIIGKAYYMNESANWRDKSYSVYDSYFQTAQRQQFRKVIILETQLKTEYEKSYKTREVLIQNYEGKSKWINLSHIRCEWPKAVRVLTDEYRKRERYDDRGRRYREHLNRKQVREQYNPALKLFVDNIKELTNQNVYTHGNISGGLNLEVLKTINEALSLLKTQKPQLTAVAS